MSLLFDMIKEDYGAIGSGRWWRSEQHSSLVYDAERDVYYYNSEGLIGDAYHYLTEVRKYPPRDAREYIKSHDGTATFIITVKNKEEIVVYPKLVDIFHDAINERVKDYFYRRTITDTTIDRFKLGAYRDFATIPVYQDDLLRQIQLRMDSPRKEIRKYYKTGSSYLFNSGILRFVDTVYLVESPISAIIMMQNGLPAISMDSGANSFSVEYYPYFIHVKKINILFDNDRAGQIGAETVSDILGETRCKVYTFWNSGVEKFGADNFFIDGGTKEDLLSTLEKESKYPFELQRLSKKRN